MDGRLELIGRKKPEKKCNWCGSRLHNTLACPWPWDLTDSQTANDKNNGTEPLHGNLSFW